MSKRCPDCGFMNEDSRIYCSSCGELLDPELRLIQSLERQKAAPEPPASRKTGGEEEYVHQRMARVQKSSPVPWIILGLIAAAAVIALIVLS